ncbi:MAG TPA: hypothetical protein VGQ78_04880 [Vicinamibacteria bacterium]|jgi:hypothetical protein|nr:hypothetical protein [Vicinamibacteria bacterium]
MIAAEGGRLQRDITAALEALQRVTAGRYVWVTDAQRTWFETGDGEDVAALRAFLEERRAALFAIPDALASGGPMDDAFEGWHDDEFLLAFVNGRVAVVSACVDAEQAREASFDVVRVLADRLFRYEPRLRIDPRGGGLFLGRARIDLVAVSGAE